VEVEIHAQMEAFRLFADGKLPEFADSHQHVHVLPGNALGKLPLLHIFFRDILIQAACIS